MPQSSTTVGFFGLGNMGLPMARNLLAAGYVVQGFDPSPSARKRAKASGLTVSARQSDALGGANVVITALPAAKHVRAAYLGEDGALARAQAGTLFIDCSTVDVETAQTVGAEAVERGHDMIDCPMSGGVPGAEKGALTFMVGGSDAAFARAKPILEVMGKNIFHAGASGLGCAAKICNNMLLGITMVGVCEAFNLAREIGLDADTLHRISSTATGRCWSLNDYCPVPGPVPAAPSNRDYRGGFAGALMLKDLQLAMDAAQGAGVATPLGAQATRIYEMMGAAGLGDRDFSAAILYLATQGRDANPETEPAARP